MSRLDEKTRDYPLGLKPVSKTITSKKDLNVLSKKEQKLKQDIFKLFDGYSNKQIIRVLAYWINVFKKK